MNRSRVLALVALCSGYLVVMIDMTIVNVALPSIQRDFRFSQPGLAWVVDGYLVAYAGCLLLAARIGDLVGAKRVFEVGLITFSIASLVCAVSSSQSMLIGSRIVQGVGGAGTCAVILGMIAQLFPAPHDRARAIGLFSVISSIGSAVGLIAGGALTQTVGWHWIFLVNVPIGSIVVLFAHIFVHPDIKRRGWSTVDVIGGVLVTLGLMTAVYSVLQLTEYGWASAQTLAVGALALALLGSFVARQLTARNPLLPMRIFRSHVMSLITVTQAATSASVLSVFFVGALDFERVLHYGPMATGLAFVPLVVATALVSLISARLILRFGKRIVLITGQIVIAVALVGFAASPLEGDYVTTILPPMVLLGTGCALLFPAMVTLAMASAETSAFGTVSGLLNTSGLVGGAFGLASLATLAGWRTEQLLRGGVMETVVALADGYHFAWAISFVIVVASVVLSIIVLRMPPKRRVVGRLVSRLPASALPRTGV